MTKRRLHKAGFFCAKRPCVMSELLWYDLTDWLVCASFLADGVSPNSTDRNNINTNYNTNTNTNTTRRVSFARNAQRYDWATLVWCPNLSLSLYTYIYAMYMYVYVCMYIYIYIYIYVCMDLSIYLYIYHLSICVSLYIYPSIYPSLSLYIYLWRTCT